MSRRRWGLVAVAVVAVAAGGAMGSSGLVTGGEPHTRSGAEGSQTSLATVERRTLATQTQVNGTLGYAGSHTVLAPAGGTITALPKVGRVIRQGQVLYRRDGAPVVLLYGSTPAYRPLAAGATASAVTGADVDQLNHDLVALGLVRRSDVSRGWDEFSWATRLGLENLQEHLGVAQTGQLDLGAVVFLPSAARVTRLLATLGGPTGGPVLTASSTARVVTVALEADLQSQVTVGDRVRITLPDSRNTPGTVTSLSRVAMAPSTEGSNVGPTVPVTIRLVHPATTGRLDQAPVEVSITDRSADDVLAVPVTALVALAGGDYAVEVVADDGAHHLARVRPGLFDDAAGLVQVSGSGLVAGQRVVVAGHG